MSKGEQDQNRWVSSRIDSKVHLQGAARVLESGPHSCLQTPMAHDVDLSNSIQGSLLSVNRTLA